jgi:hypothetical protein
LHKIHGSGEPRIALGVSRIPFTAPFPTFASIPHCNVRVFVILATASFVERRRGDLSFEDGK